MYKLVISDDEGKTTIVPLVRDEITIGRKEGNTIRLTERNVSRRHARLTKSNGRISLDDLQSYNGVKINGRRIEASSTLAVGDQIQIGDFLLALQSDVVTEPTSAPTGDAVADVPTALINAPMAPARLVMLTPPTPGADFPLHGARARVGRAEDLEIRVNHRSISREHAEFQKEEDGYRLIDSGSANGVRVNSQDVQNAILEPGDMVELGQVRFRFVGPGEDYQFEAAKTIQMDALDLEMPTANRTPMLIAIGIVAFAIVCALVAGIVILRDDPPQVAVQPANPLELAAGETTLSLEARLNQALASCETALSSSEPSGALAAAAEALQLQPGHDAATDCRDRALAMQGELEAFNRGVAAMQAGNLEDGYFAMETLPAESPFRQRPGFSDLMHRYSRDQLDRAQRLLDSEPSEALRLAQFVQTMSVVEDADRSEARSIARSARRRGAQAASRSARRREPRPNRARPPSKTRANRTNRSNRNSRPAQAPNRAAEPSASDRLTQARDCTARGDNRCVIRLLEGRARSAMELGLLIEAYRASGQTAAKFRSMRRYVQRFNDARARRYRQELAASGS